MWHPGEMGRKSFCSAIKPYNPDKNLNVSISGFEGINTLGFTYGRVAHTCNEHLKFSVN
jgi:hypothetical protein